MPTGRSLYLALLPAILLLTLLTFGLAKLIAVSFDTGHGIGLASYVGFFARPDYVRMLWRTLLVALATTVICVLIGYPTAWFISRCQAHRSLFLLLVILPWLVSVVVRTYGWIVLLGNKGLINNLLVLMGATQRPIPLMFNLVGVIIGLVHISLPFMILAILAAFRHLDGALAEAAMSLGARPWQSFRRVILPLTMPGVMSGCSLVFLSTTGVIVTPLLLGGLRDGMMGTQIYQEMFIVFSYPKAATMAVLLALCGVLVIVPLQWLERRMSRHSRAAQA
ncbi:MAG: ABC transporter permease [Acetobacteraceae bacterium]